MSIFTALIIGIFTIGCMSGVMWYLIDIRAKKAPVTIWHNSKEMPRPFRPILYISKDYYASITMQILESNWKTKVSNLDIKHWCYVKDLFKIKY